MPTIGFMQVLMLFGALQGLILLAALSSSRHWRTPANRVLALFTGAIVFLLSLVVLIELDLVPSASRFGYLGDSVGLLYGPLFYFYVLRLLTLSKERLRAHLIPFWFFVTLNSALLLAPQLRTYAWIDGLYPAMTSVALIQLAIYLLLTWRLIRQYRKGAPAEFSAYSTFEYLNVLILIIGSCLLLFTVNYLSQLLGYTAPFTWLGYELGWLLLSAVTLATAYFAIRQPEIFRLRVKLQPQNGTATQEEIGEVLRHLINCLREEQPYLDPELTLEGLASRIGFRKELVSRAINRGLSINFYRLINEYRIEAFELLARDPANSHLTHHALALEAGFRSKTTFYKAFRELKQTTPAAYLKSVD